VLLELPPQEIGIGGFAAEAVAVLSKHQGDATSRHKVAHAVHTWPLKACAALSGVYYLLQDLVPFTGGVLP
jgi:hypothetical protein